MNTYLIKPTLWAGLIALVLSIAACQTTGRPAAEVAMDRPCPFIYDLNKANGIQQINIEYNGSNYYVPAEEKTTPFLRYDDLQWNVNTPQIEFYQIKFVDSPGLPGCPTNLKALPSGPCKNIQNKWSNGESAKTATSGDPIVCDAIPGASPPSRFSQLDYCYTITVWDTNGDPHVVDPVGTGSGCSGCHADTGF